MSALTLRQLSLLPPAIKTLEQHAVEEGFRFLSRLIDDWDAGTNRFDAPGECLLAGYVNEELVAVGGLSIDPYLPIDPLTGGRIGRLRRVYVTPALRGQGIGKAMVEALVAHAGDAFGAVRLSTDTVNGDGFYRSCGFQSIEDAQATHVRLLPPLNASEGLRRRVQ